jgi:hypothetical protein
MEGTRYSRENKREDTWRIGVGGGIGVGGMWRGRGGIGGDRKEARKEGGLSVRNVL